MLAVTLIDKLGAPIASARVAWQSDRYVGTVDLSATPPGILTVLREYEEIIEGQMLSLLDASEDRVAELGIVARFPDGHEAAVKDLQIYPATNQISFLTALRMAPDVNGAHPGSAAGQPEAK